MNITQIVQIGSAIASLYPVASQMVGAVEQAFPAGTPGAVKLGAVKAGLQTAYSVGGAVVIEFEQLWPHLQAIITAIVAGLNAIGIFKKSTPAPAA